MPRAVFIDALGTMVRLLPPWERIEPELVEGVAPARIRDAFVAEMAYYREHAEEGADPESLADLRRRCAAVLSRGLGRELAVGQMMSAIAFETYPEVPDALERLRRRGAALVAVSNWDCSLPGVLDELGLASLLDGVVTSAGAGARKPDPAIFGPALALARCRPADAVHVGDSDEDVAAATAAGIEAVRIDRSGSGGPREISSLSEVADRFRGGSS